MFTVVVVITSRIEIGPADDECRTAGVVCQRIEIYFSDKLDIFIVDIKTNTCFSM